MPDGALDAFDSAIAELIRRREQRRVAAESDADAVPDRANRHETTAATYDRVIEILRDVRDRHARAAEREADAAVVFEFTTTTGDRRRYRIEPTGVAGAPYVLAEQQHDGDGWRPVGTEPLTDYDLVESASAADTIHGP